MMTDHINAPATTADVFREVQALQDMVTDSRGLLMDREQVADAVKSGLMQAVSDPSFWAAASGAMQHHAKVEAGGLLIGAIKGFAAKAFWFGIAGLVIYNIGGWTALVAWFKASQP